MSRHVPRLPPFKDVRRFVVFPSSEYVMVIHKVPEQRGERNTIKLTSMSDKDGNDFHDDSGAFHDDSDGGGVADDVLVMRFVIVVIAMRRR